MSYQADLLHQQDSLSVSRMSSKIANHLSLLRPSHWAKSIIAIPIGPLLLAGQASWSALATLAGTILMFMVAASAIYVVNDLLDMERDSMHPTKCARPLACGAVSPHMAKVMLAGLVLVLAALALSMPLILSTVVLFYFALNVAYSLRLKHAPIVEMLVVAAGFALRVVAGYLAFATLPDQTVVATVFAGALLLTVGKRRSEMQRAADPAMHRPVLAHYSVKLLDMYLIVSAIACFGAGLLAMLHIFEARGLPVLFLISLPFAIYLFQRYLMLAFVGTGTGNPTKMLLTDRTIHLVLAVWGGCLVIGGVLSQAAGPLVLSLAVPTGGLQ